MNQRQTRPNVNDVAGSVNFDNFVNGSFDFVHIHEHVLI